MKPKHIKKALLSEIDKVANNPKDYCFHPDTDFTIDIRIGKQC